ncbi:MAG: non-homologous end-joining DNA ligase [Verrucomicrobiota bacterium]
MPRETELDVGGKRLQVSNLNKVLYPKAGFTKGDVIDFYIKISPYLLPHLDHRPLTMKRYPNGVEAEFFYEKKCPSHRPPWVNTAKVWSEGNQADIYFCMANDLPTLVWAANLADLELHTSLSRYPKVQTPTMVVFDLDPGPPADIVQCCQVGISLRKILLEMGLDSFPKTSGSKGLQIYAPLNTATNYENTKSFAKAVAERLELEHPKLVVSRMAKVLREGKVFVDWSQNDNHKTTICVYSLRAKDKPTVSTPLTWKEVEVALKKEDASKLVFTSGDVLARVKKWGDLFEPVLKMKQRLKFKATS